MTNEDRKTSSKIGWGDLKALTVDECIERISAHSDLKFILTAAGCWLILRWLVGLWILGHVSYLFYRLIVLVLG